MKMLGFDECKITIGVFTHRERDLRVAAHVDDFLLSGEMQDLSWLRDRLKEKYELKVQVAGWERGDARELSFLGRVIRTTSTGIELEGDDKHVSKLEEEWGMANCNPVATPYVKPSGSFNRLEGDEAKAMSPADAVSPGRCAY